MSPAGDVLRHAPGDPGGGGSPDPVKPRLRGVFHQVAFFVSLVSGVVLIVVAPTLGSKLIMAVYALSISTLFGVSALFHRHTWGPVGRRRMRRADHSTIFIAIAGSYTAVAGIALSGWARTTVLCIVWGGAAVGITLRQVWLDAPKWVIALPYVVVGWAAVAVLPQLERALGPAGFALLLVGGLAYSAGAVVYAVKRPNPIPGVLGYHEVFHACTIVGAVFHFIVIAWFVLPLAWATLGAWRAGPIRCPVSADQLAEHVGKDPAVAVVLGLHRGVDPHPGVELDHAVAVDGPDRDRLGAGPLVERSEPGDGEDLVPGQAQGGRVLTVGVLHGKHPHPDQVGAVDALVALGDDRADTEKRGPFGRPVAGGSRSVLLAGQDHQRDAFGRVAHRGVVDGGLFAVGQMEGEPALGARCQLVTQPNVGERAPHHHLVVAAPRPVGVEVCGLDPVLGQVPACRCGRADVSGRRDVVGGHAVAELGQYPGPDHVGHRCRGHGEALEEGGTQDVGGVDVPVEGVAGCRLDRLPPFVAVEDRCVPLAEHLGGE